jgi:hypothetical protein
MKSTVLVLLVLAVSTAAYAEGPNDQQRLAQIKAVKMQGIDGRLSLLQQDKSCVQAASTMDAFNSCEQSWRQGMRQIEEKQKAGWESLKASNQQGKAQKNK